MDILLLVAAALCLLVGFAGCVLPILPGPPVSWVALLLLKWTSFGSGLSWTWIAVLAGLALAVTVLDYLMPAWGTKKLGGTRAGSRGAVVGLMVGLFFGLPGLFFGPFLGALTGELIAGTPGRRSLWAAFGAFIGFLFGVGFKLIVCSWISLYFAVQFFI
jgi:uncharacterized protein YqgC (DUF456 family)